MSAGQLLAYLEFKNKPVGLLINVGARTLREGLRRIVNGVQSSAISAVPRLRVNQGLPTNANRKGPAETV